MLTASSDGSDPHPVWSCRMLREAFQPCQQDGSNKHSNLESGIALLGNLLCLVASIFSCLRMNAVLWAVNTLPTGHVSSPWRLGGAGRLPGSVVGSQGGRRFLPACPIASGGRLCCCTLSGLDPSDFAFGHMYTKIVSGQSFLSKRQEELVMDSKAQTL